MQRVRQLVFIMGNIQAAHPCLEALCLVGVLVSMQLLTLADL